MAGTKWKPWTSRPGVPEWVSAFTDLGRPFAVVVVLALCAPGERHIARLAGWSPDLSWGMAGLLSLYAGLSAVVAANRPKGAPGKRTAVVGAALALVLAMGANPVAHLFMTGWLSATPRTPWQLVVVVSAIPALVGGHILHLAAHPEQLVDDVRHAVRRPSAPRTAVSAPAVRPPAPALPQQSAERGQTVPAASVPAADMSVSPDKAVSAPADNTADTGGQSNVSQIGQAHGLAALVRALHTDGLSEADIRTEVLRQFPDTKTDTLGKTIRRELGPRHARRTA